MDYGSGAVRLLQEFRQGHSLATGIERALRWAGFDGKRGRYEGRPYRCFFRRGPAVGRSRGEDLRRCDARTHRGTGWRSRSRSRQAACVWRNKTRPNASGSHRFLPFVARLCPPGATRDGLLSAANLPDSTPPTEAAAVLGCGEKLLSADTVPFALWCAERNVNEFEQALWTTVEGLGDRDTTCAMVGGIVSATSPPPPRWVNAREPLRFEKPLASGRRSELRQRAQAWLWSLRAGNIVSTIARWLCCIGCWSNAQTLAGEYGRSMDPLVPSDEPCQPLAKGDVRTPPEQVKSTGKRTPKATHIMFPRWRLLDR